jgi:hypothetical protein
MPKVAARVRSRRGALRALLALAAVPVLVAVPVLAGLALPGCLSPTIPLPPPSRPTVSPPDGSGVTTVSGRVPSEATAYVENLATGRIAGQVTEESGRYAVSLPASADDVLLVWYEEGGVESLSTEVTVPSTDPALPLMDFGGASGSE